ncbi:MAG: FHA domain-containing protein [Planctomycetes bacterium]|nr:FHA domain-containing protein [Planctomycetota bacterium]
MSEQQLQIYDALGEPIALVGAAEFSIGRDACCDLVLTDSEVSRLHCQLRRVSAGYVLSDLGSSHGTWVNGAEVTQVVLRHGDVVRLSRNTEFRVAEFGRTLSVETTPASMASPVYQRRSHWPRRVATILLYVGVLGGTAFGLLHWWDQSNSEKLRREELQASLEATNAEALKLEELRAETLGTLQSLALHPDFASAAEFEAGLRAARPLEPPDLISDVVYESVLASGREVLMKRAQARAGAARLRAQEELSQRQYGKALRVLDDAARDPSLDESGRVRVRSLTERATTEARAEFEVMGVQLKAAQPRAARHAILAALARFEGTAHEGELRAQLGRIALEPVVTPEATPVVVAVADSGGAAWREATAAAEALAAKRDFTAAAAAYRAAAETAGAHSSRELCRTRQARMERLAKFPALLNSHVLAHPAAFRGVSLGNEMRGDLKSVDETGLDFQLGAGARLKLEWSRFEPARQALVLHAARFKGDEARTAAEWLLEARDPERALGLLAVVGLHDAEFRTQVADLVAEAKGIAGVPLGGFQFFSGTFLTAEEKTALTNNLHIEAAAAKTDIAVGLEWRVALDELLASGDGGRAAARKALASRYARSMAAARALPDFAGASLTKLRAKLRGELDEARTHALELIRDARRYPYPYAENQAEVQGEVDERVARVEELWNVPSRRVLDRSEALRKAYTLLEETARATVEAGGDDPSPQTLLTWVDQAIDIAAVALDPKDAEHLEERRDLMGLGDSTESVMSIDERACIRATNDYRLMMGLDPVLPDDRLVKCARGHSEEMQRLGFFSHTSPTKGREGPGQRARLSGWTGGVSENIAMGQATGGSAVAAWRHSSGHHRNLLGRWTHLGCGKADGAWWTQNFSNGPQPNRRSSSSRGSDH